MFYFQGTANLTRLQSHDLSLTAVWRYGASVLACAMYYTISDVDHVRSFTICLCAILSCLLIRWSASLAIYLSLWNVCTYMSMRMVWHASGTTHSDGALVQCDLVL